MILTEDNKFYPKSFLKLKKKPKTIHIEGDINTLNTNKAIAIVGSRKMTTYGQKVIDIFVPELVSAGFTIVSGFMYGVDTYAHELTVESGGKTIAVLGSGIKSIYPAENKELYTKIINGGGAVISEYNPDQKPKPWMFAKRNRLVAALSINGVVIVEAGLKSGSLITANRAIELDIPVYAVPGPITSQVSKGTNELIVSGKARVLTSPSQITMSNLSNQSEKANLNFDSKLQQDIYNLLQNEDLSIDQITAKIGKDAQEISSALMEMDIAGIIAEDRGIFRIN